MKVTSSGVEFMDTPEEAKTTLVAFKDVGIHCDVRQLLRTVFAVTSSDRS